MQAPDIPTDNYQVTPEEAIALLKQRGAPITPFNINGAKQILLTNPQLRPSTQLDGVNKGYQPGDVQVLPPSSQDEAAVSQQMNGGQSLVSDPQQVLAQRAATPKPNPEANPDVAAQPTDDGTSLSSYLPSPVASATYAAAGALAGALARRRGISVPNFAGGARASAGAAGRGGGGGGVASDGGAVVNSTTPASAARSPSPADPAPSGTSRPGSGETSGGKDIAVNDGTPDTGSPTNKIDKMATLQQDREAADRGERAAGSPANTFGAIERKAATATKPARSGPMNIPDDGVQVKSKPASVMKMTTRPDGVRVEAQADMNGNHAHALPGGGIALAPAGTPLDELIRIQRSPGQGGGRMSTTPKRVNDGEQSAY